MYCKVCSSELRIDLERTYCPECECVWYCFAHKGERIATQQNILEYPWVTATRDILEAIEQAGPSGEIYKVRLLHPGEDEPVAIEDFPGWFEFPAKFVGWVERRNQARHSGPYPKPDQDLASE